MHHTDDQWIGRGLTFVAGMAAGYGLTLLLSSSREEQRKLIEDKAQRLRDMLNDSELAERVKDVFKKNTSEFRTKYQDIKEQIISSVAELQSSLKNIDEKKYRQVVDDVLENAMEDGEISEEQLTKLRRYLRSDFKKIKHQTNIN